MIDHFVIFTKGGIVLFSYTQAQLRGSPVDHLIRTVLLEERSADSTCVTDQYAMKWTFANELELVFVIVYQRILSLLYLDELLSAVKKAFCDLFGSSVRAYHSCSFEFAETFERIMQEIESNSVREKTQKKTPKSFNETEKGQKLQKEKGEKENEKQAEKAKEREEARERKEEENQQNGREKEAEGVESSILENRERMKQKLAAKGKDKEKKLVKSVSATSVTSKKERGARKWDDSVSHEEKKALDFSKKAESADLSSSGSVEPVDFGTTDLDKWDYVEEKETEGEEEEEEEEQDMSEKKAGKGGKVPVQAGASTGSTGGFMSFFKTLTGGKVLAAEDLSGVLDQFKQHLIGKNVASDIADQLCASVQASLVGKKLGSFTGVRSTVRVALEEALIRILTPKKNIDILRDVLAAKQQGRPYIITFCGVNGVGKSTNLAKVCCWLQQNGLKVLITACDTFRSGAVEQLNVHCKRLGVELYERGYRTDPTLIAQEAVKYAGQKGLDVVMIDTAGRMQDNAALMQALARLVGTVKPDLVLFVGEALVGNDGVDQVVKFNQALVDLSFEKEPRTLDGIILTKFDTIDDKVGAAISMVYSTGKPIVFLGVGQHYTDLKRMNVNVVTAALLKGA